MIRSVRSYNVLKSLAPAKILNVRFCSSNFNDKELQRSFKGKIPRIFALWNIISKPGRKYFRELIDAKIISKSRIFNGLSLYIDLQNPLLVKYGFDPFDFVVGAKEAYIQIKSRILSEEFHDFAKEKIQRSEKAEELKEFVSPSIYEEILLIPKISTVPRVVVTNIEVKEVILKSVKTYISDTVKIPNGKNWKELSDELEPDYERVAVSYYVKKEIGFFDALRKIWQLGEDALFTDTGLMPAGMPPIGSVVARVKVFFKAIEKFVKESKEFEKEVLSELTFEACISGQVEMEWKFVAFKTVKI